MQFTPETRQCDPNLSNAILSVAIAPLTRNITKFIKAAKTSPVIHRNFGGAFGAVAYAAYARSFLRRPTMYFKNLQPHHYREEMVPVNSKSLTAEEWAKHILNLFDELTPLIFEIDKLAMKYFNGASLIILWTRMLEMSFIIDIESEDPETRLSEFRKWLTLWLAHPDVNGGGNADFLGYSAREIQEDPKEFAERMRELLPVIEALFEKMKTDEALIEDVVKLML